MLVFWIIEINKSKGKCKECDSKNLLEAKFELLKKAFPYTNENLLKNINYFCEKCQKFLDKNFKEVNIE